MITREIIEKWMLENGGSILRNPDRPEVITGYVTITPERAEALLGINTSNRPLGRSKQVPGLMDAMANGYWDEDVSKINIAINNVLSDGQNRLFSVVQTQTTIKSLLTYGVRESAQRVTDRRGNRTLGNDLAIGGFTSGCHKAALTRLMFLSREENVEIKKLLNFGHKFQELSDVRLYDYFLANQDEITERQKRVAQIYDGLRDLEISQTILNVLVPEFDAVSYDDADCFWERLSTGVTTTEDDPIVMLRKKLAANAHGKVNKIPRHVIAALIIKAWNFYMRGETPKLLKYTSGGANPEPFPEIYNPYMEGLENA